MLRYIGETFYGEGTTSNRDLEQHMLFNPEVLEQFIQTHSQFALTKIMDGLGVKPGSNIKQINDIKVRWQISDLPDKLYNFVQAPVPNTNIGLGDSEFRTYLDDLPGRANEILLLEDQSQIVIIRDPIIISSGVVALDCKLITNNPNATLNPLMVQPGRTCNVLHGVFPEYSDNASERKRYSRWAEEYIGIDRVKHSFTGTAKGRVLMYKNSSGEKVWIRKEKQEIIQRMLLRKEYKYWYGKSTMGADGVCNVHDDKGQELVQGNGFLEQIDNSRIYTYNRLAIRLFHDILMNLSIQANEHDDNTWIMMGGSGLIAEFAELMRDYHLPGSTHIYNVRGNKVDLGIDFNSYRFAGQTIIVKRATHFDAPYLASEKDAITGKRVQSYWGVIFPMNMKGNSYLTPLEFENRGNISKEINGMVSYGDIGNAIAVTPLDGAENHWLCHTGLAVLNPLEGSARLIKI